jgi:hypothetical protein
MPIDFDTCMANLATFLNNAPETSIKFLFFYSSDLNHPKIKDVFRKWDGRFVLPGLTTNNVYVYQESALKYVVSAACPTGKTNEYDVSILRMDPSNGDVNHGDHVDFGIYRQRDGSVLVLTHKTEYLDVTGNFDFHRSQQSCNFSLSDAADVGSLADFAKNRGCMTKSGGVTGTINNVYDADAIETVHDLCDIATASRAMPGGSRAKRYTYHGGRRRLLRQRDGKHFVRTKRGDVFMQKGGGNAYKGVTFVSDRFISFVTERFLRPLYALRGDDLISAQLVYDELNEVSPNGNRYFVLMYDFERGTRNVFYVDFVLASVACYADAQVHKGKGANLTAHEKGCLRAFDETYPAHRFVA